MPPQIHLPQSTIQRTQWLAGQLDRLSRRFSVDRTCALVQEVALFPAKARYQECSADHPRWVSTTDGDVAARSQVKYGSCTLTRSNWPEIHVRRIDRPNSPSKRHGYIDLSSASYTAIHARIQRKNFNEALAESRLTEGVQALACRGATSSGDRCPDARYIRRRPSNESCSSVYGRQSATSRSDINFLALNYEALKQEPP